MTKKFQRLKDPLEDVQARIFHVKKWDKRLNDLKNKGMSQKEFCLAHGFHDSFISNRKSERFAHSIPKWSTIKKVEEALEAEGV